MYSEGGSKGGCIREVRPHLHRLRILSYYRQSIKLYSGVSLDGPVIRPSDDTAYFRTRGRLRESDRKDSKFCLIRFVYGRTQAAVHLRARA